MLNTCFLSESWELWQRVPVANANKNAGHWVSNELPRYTTLHTCCHNSKTEEFSMFCVTPLWEDSWKLIRGFLWTAAHTTFPLLILLCILSLINHSHRDNYTVSLVSPPSKSPNLEVAWGIQDTIVNKYVFGDNSKFMSPEINFLLSFRRFHPSTYLASPPGNIY